MIPLRIIALFLAFLVIAECQNWKKKWPKSPFTKGGKRRDMVNHNEHNNHNNNHNNNKNPHRPKSWNQWPGAGSDHVDGHGDNHRHGSGSHTHTLGLELPRGNGQGIGGNCGGQQYAGRTHICCGGTVKRRKGMRPACCGTQVFDFVFDLCCDGRITKRTVSRPVC